jgi:phosphoenolpyruvate-protein kinase (PTS system EI component)
VKIHRCYLAAIIQAALLTIASPVAHAQETTTDGYVTRKEYEELKAQLLAMKKELDALRKERAVAPKRESSEGQAIADVHKEVIPKQENAESHADEDMHEEVTANVVPSVTKLEASLLGTTKFLLAGWAEGIFEARNGEVSTFRPLSIQSSFGN